MPVTDWDNKEIRDLLDRLMKKYKVTSIVELSKIVGINKLTLYHWRTGNCKRKPSKSSIQKLKDALLAPAWGSDEYRSQAFIAYDTTSYDAAAGMYSTVRTNGKHMPSFMASMSVAAKVADLLEMAIAERTCRRVHSIIRVTSMFGDPENNTAVDIAYVRWNGDYADYSSVFTVKSASIGGLERYVYTVNNVSGGRMVSHVSGIVTDKGIDRAVKSMVQLVTNREKKLK